MVIMIIYSPCRSGSPSFFILSQCLLSEGEFSVLYLCVYQCVFTARLLVVFQEGHSKTRSMNDSRSGTATEHNGSYVGSARERDNRSAETTHLNRQVRLSRA